MTAKNDNTVQENMAALSELLAWFDSDEFSIEQSVDKFRQAKQLAEVIEAQLEGVTNEIRVVKQSFEDA